MGGGGCLASELWFLRKCKRCVIYIKGRKCFSVSVITSLFILVIAGNRLDAEIIKTSWSSVGETLELRFCIEYRSSTWRPWELEDNFFYHTFVLQFWSRLQSINTSIY